MAFCPGGILSGGLLSGIQPADRVSIFEAVSAHGYNLRNRHHNRHLTDHFSPESYSETRIGFLFYLIVPILFLLMCIVAICQRLVKRIYGYGYGYGLNRRTIINPRIMLHAPVVFE